MAVSGSFVCLWNPFPCTELPHTTLMGCVWSYFSFCYAMLGSCLWQVCSFLRVGGESGSGEEGKLQGGSTGRGEGRKLDQDV